MWICNQKIVALVFSSIIGCVGLAQPAVDNILKTLAPVHPRLFANYQKIAAIKLQKDTITKQLLFIIKATAEKKLTEPVINYPNSKSNFGASRNVQGRIISLAMAYRLLNDKRFLEKAKQDLLQLAALNDWGVGHFLDVGEASLAAGIGFDWLYNDLTENEIQIVADAIKNNALLPSLQVKEVPDNRSWVNGNFNWNPVCHGGLMVGALAIAERQPALSKQIIERGLKYIPIAGDAYSPDGAFAEGPSYWSYGTSFYVFAIEAIKTALGISAGLESIPGFLKTADYNNQMVGATGEEFNYSDYHKENLNEPIMLWFANKLNRPDLIKDELNDITRLQDFWLKGGLAKPGNTIQQNRHTPLQILWWNPALISSSTDQKTNSKAPLHWTANGLMPVAVMRSSWNDPSATFVAIKGGTPNNSHGHMDVGSFVVEADNVRWALDLGTESYDKMRAAKLDLWNYSQNSDRWSTFRCGPEGHNILRFNNERQQISGKGEIKTLQLTNGAMGNEANLTSLYLKYAAKVTRSIILNKNRSVIIKDEWIAKDSALTYSFQWLTTAVVTKNSKGLLLEQNGQKLQINISQLPNQSVVEVQDVSKGKAMQDSDNPGLKRIVITQQTAATKNGSLNLYIEPGSIIKNVKN